MALAPLVFVLAARLDLTVSDLEELQLLEIRVRDTPASLKVEIEPIAEDVSQSLEGVLGLDALGFRSGRVVRGVEAKVFEHPLGEHVVSEATTGLLGDRGEQRATEQEHLKEVVEMSRLEAGVLTVVRERE